MDLELSWYILRYQFGRKVGSALIGLYLRCQKLMLRVCYTEDVA